MSAIAPNRVLTEFEINRYQRDGVICLKQFFSADWVSAMRDAAEVSLADPGELHAELAQERQDAGRFFHDTFIWQRNATCRNYVFESPAAPIARQLMRTEKVNIFFDQWLIKEPGTSTKTPWHHDMTYWPIDGNDICTLWLALDVVTANSGAVEYVKGSHRWGQKFQPASFGHNSQYTEDIPAVPDIESMRGDLDIVQYELEPGDCTVHHGLTVHSAPGNQSSDIRRRAHTSRWAGDDVIFHPREGLQEMPEFPPDLKNGDPLDSELWPIVD